MKQKNRETTSVLLPISTLSSIMQQSLLAFVFLAIFVSTAIQALPITNSCSITERPALCPEVTANDSAYALCLARSTVQLSNFTLPVIVTYEEQRTIRDTLLGTDLESSYTKCLKDTSPIPSPLSTPDVCSSEYQCDYDAGRFPQYIAHVVCKDKRVKYPKGGQWAECQCRPIYRPIPVLRFVGCDPYEQWRMEEQSVSVGCSCTNVM